MGRIGFWQLLLDDRISYWESNAINSAWDAAEHARYQAQTTQQDLQQLHQRMTAMNREIVMLRTALTVLVTTLRDTNVVDAQILDARLEAALEEAMAPPPTIPAAGEPKPPLPTRPLVCIRCRTEVPASNTTMTAEGPICDRCG